MVVAVAEAAAAAAATTTTASPPPPGGKPEGLLLNQADRLHQMAMHSTLP